MNWGLGGEFIPLFSNAIYFRDILGGDKWLQRIQDVGFRFKALIDSIEGTAGETIVIELNSPEFNADVYSLISSPKPPPKPSLPTTVYFNRQRALNQDLEQMQRRGN
ncbi:MAG: hypothetical protein KME07_21560 [Pegethrix bostrychoides GSE-TBD4-15B]|jgi:hypothetical protein|uniref:Uncharacterized protein n=1 Tax=Pegethrix bostrychoides GSE-TBD4-15B TaxID=2839662 RepID=A0A951PE95_9CYAN|nr:hypothetical protein [Pegethrix bostrychoides GSE-TBD4-15B]